MPNKRGDVEEERRVAFVAACRAMKMLFLTYSRMYMGKQVKRSALMDGMIKGYTSFARGPIVIYNFGPP